MFFGITGVFIAGMLELFPKKYFFYQSDLIDSDLNDFFELFSGCKNPCIFRTHTSASNICPNHDLCDFYDYHD